MTDQQSEALIRADELENIGAESSLARAMAAHTIRLLHKENETLRARLAQPEPKYQPMHPELRKMYEDYFDAAFEKLVPPQREWQGLTDEEILEEYRQSYGDDGNLTDVYFAQAIEAILKEKNNAA